MASKYEYGLNQFNDFLVTLLLYGVDISEIEFKGEIDDTFKSILENVLEDEKLFVHLQYKIKNDNEWYEVIGMNSISAFWLSGLFIKDVDIILKNNKFVIDGMNYKYSKKNHKLICLSENE